MDDTRGTASAATPAPMAAPKAVSGPPGISAVKPVETGAVDPTRSSALFEQWEKTNKDLEGLLTKVPERPQTNPMQAFGSLGGVLGLVGGLFMRQPAMAMLTTTASAMEALKKNDVETYATDMQKWQMHRDYLTQVSTSVAKQLDLLQKSQHYTNVEAMQMRRLLLQAHGIDARHAKMVSGAAATLEKEARSDARNALRMGVLYFTTANSLSDDTRAEGLRALNEAYAGGSLNHGTAARLMADIGKGAAKGGKGARDTEARVARIGVMQEQFDKGAKKITDPTTGEEFTREDYKLVGPGGEGVASTAAQLRLAGILKVNTPGVMKPAAAPSGSKTYTEDDVKHMVQSRGMSREQVVSALKERGFMPMAATADADED